MSQTNNPLIVPMTVEALVVNNSVRGNIFVRSQMQYDLLNNTTVGPGNAQGGLNNNDTDFTTVSGDIPNTQISTADYYNGVYLKWRLPKAFTHGVHNAQQHNTVFPLVPNRWLVVRYSGTNLAQRTATAWIIESDYEQSSPPSQPQNIAQESTEYLSTTQALTPTWIGRNINLATQSWQESGHSLNLTAVGPGNPAFAAYQPQCNNVFSFVDCLNDTAAQTFSYAVYGWFSSATDDPLSNPNSLSFADLLTSLSWTIPKDTPKGTQASWCLLSGAVDGVQWQTTQLPAGGTPTGENPIAIAVGNTATEALTSLISTQSSGSIAANFLNAFQLDALDLLDRPDGIGLVAEKLQASFFQKYSGGYHWSIVDAPNDTTPISNSELQKEQTWLATLNQAQTALDQAILTLAELQTQLYVMWWKSIQPYKTITKFIDHKFKKVPANPSQPDPQFFAQQLDPQTSGSIAYQTNQQLQHVQTLLQSVPHGNTPAALEAAIQSYAQTQQLPSSRQLKRLNNSAFFVPNDPVVLLTGTGAAGIASTADSVLCRFPSQLVSGFTYQGHTINAATSGLSIPQPTLTQVTGAPWTAELMTALTTENFFLDPNNAAALNAAVAGSGTAGVNAQNVLGTYPDTVAVHQWQQNPWRPLLLLWEGKYYPIDYGTAAAPNWSFSDHQYQWNGELASVGSLMALSGLIQLAPTAATNMKARIQKFLTLHPNLTPQETAAFNTLLTFVTQSHEWELLSQSLDGFNSQLRLALPGVYPGPNTSSAAMASLIGHTDTKPPLLLDDVNDQPPPSQFQPWRSGQFEFSSLVIVDEWGQALWPINLQDQTLENLYLPAELTPHYQAPDTTGGSGTAPVYNGHSRIQFPPALLQPAQLNFSLISATSDNTAYVPGNAATDPICGWVLPNHLDASLMAYDAQGNALGEMAANATATQINWTPLPNSPYTTLQQIATAIPHFGQFLVSLQQQSVSTFAAFLTAIDETLWTTAPIGTTFDKDLSILMGRPLAMLRAKLQLDLNAAPYNDPSWQYTQTPAQSPLPGYQFAIELGNRQKLDDGLIGYFTQGQYDTFNIVTEADSTNNSYLNTIGNSNNYIYLPVTGENSAYVSMLVDPRAAIHATTAILPIVQLRPPPHLIAEALAKIKISFKVDGILTDQQINHAGISTVLMPTPKTKAGQWNWLEQDSSSTWNNYTVAANNNQARLSNILPTLRRGRLQLSNALPKDKQQQKKQKP